MSELVTDREAQELSAAIAKADAENDAVVFCDPVDVFAELGTDDVDTTGPGVVSNLLHTRSALIEALEEMGVALRVALHFTEAPYDGDGADSLIGARLTESQTRQLLSTIHATEGEK